MPTSDEGAGVVTTRGDVHYIVTEYGVAYLHGKSLRERALALISIAHPKFREELLRKAKEMQVPLRGPGHPRRGHLPGGGRAHQVSLAA